jgi:hypothetical protein
MTNNLYDVYSLMLLKATKSLNAKIENARGAEFCETHLSSNMIGPRNYSTEELPDTNVEQTDDEIDAYQEESGFKMKDGTMNNEEEKRGKNGNDNIDDSDDIEDLVTSRSLRMKIQMRESEVQA